MTITGTGYTYDATATYIPGSGTGDVIGTEADISAATYIGTTSTWAIYGAANTSAHTITATGITAHDVFLTGISNQETAGAVSASPNPACAGGTNPTLSTSGASSDAGSIGYSWTSPDGGMFDATVGTYSATAAVDATVAGTHTYSLTITDGNGLTASSGVIVTVNATPTANDFNQTPASASICNTSDMVISVASTSLAHTDYTVSYTVNGGTTHTADLNFTSGSPATFTIPHSQFPANGLATIVVTQVQNVGTSCVTTTFTGSQATTSFYVSSGSISVSGFSPSASDICSGPETIGFPSSLTDDIYVISYTINGGSTLTATTTPTSGGIGHFDITSPAAGNNHVVYTQIANSCTSTTSSPLGSVANNFYVGVPVVSNFTSITASDICTGGSTTVTVNSTTLKPFSSTTVNFDLAAPNAGSGLTATLTMGGSGTGTFTYGGISNPSASEGITINHIDNTCGSSSTLSSGNTTSFAVNGQPSLAGLGNSGDICSGGTSTLTAGTLSGGAGTITYHWLGTAPTLVSATTSGNTNTAVITATGSQTYSVTVSATGNGCNTSGYYATTFNVNTVPTLAPSNSGAICAGNAVGLIANATGGVGSIYSFSWTGSGYSSPDVVPSNVTAANPSIASGTTVYSVTATQTASGCTSAQYTTTVTVNAVAAYTSITPTGLPVCDGINGTVNIASTGLAAGNYTVQYSTGTGTAHDQSTITIDGSGNGFLTIPTGDLAAGTTNTVTFETIRFTSPSTTCTTDISAISTASIVDNVLPTVTFTNLTADACVGTAKTLNFAYSAASGADQYTLVWTGASPGPVDGNVSSFTSFPSSPITAGTASGTAAGGYTATLTVMNTASTCTNTYSLSINNHNLPNVSTTLPDAASNICQGSTTTLGFGSMALPTAIYSLTYDVSNPSSTGNLVTGVGINGGSGGSGGFTTIPLTSSGAETITINTIIDPFGCVGVVSAPNTWSFSVNPTPSLTTTAYAGCTGSPAGINLAATTSGTSSFTWTVGASGSNISGANPGSGTTINDVIVNSGAGDQTQVYNVTPTSGAGCPGSPTAVTYTAHLLPTAILFGYGTPGSPICQSTTPVSPFGLSSVSVDGFSVSPSSGLSIDASGNISTDISTVGVYTVTVSFHDTHCSNTATTVVTIDPVASITSLSGPSVACTGTTFTLTANGTPTGGGSSFYTYNWSGDAGSGIGTFSSTATNTALVTSPSIHVYSVMVSTSNPGCNSIYYTTSVTINPVPSYVGLLGTSSCSGIAANIALSATTSGTSVFTWTLGTTGAGISGENACSGGSCGNTITDALTNSGSSDATQIYNVSIVSAAGCPSAGPQTIVYTVHPLPTAILFGYGAPGTPFCQVATPVSPFGLSSVSVDGFSVNPSTGLSIDASGNITTDISTVGVYTVTVSFHNATTLCANTATTVVSINAVPSITSLSTSSPVCAGTTFTLTANGTPTGGYGSLYTYNWSGDAGSGIGTLSSTATNTASVASASSHVYSVTVSTSGSGCTSIYYTTTVSINPVPSYVGLLGTSACSGIAANIVLSATTAGTSQFTWALGTTGAGITGENACSGSSCGNTITDALVNSGTSDATQVYNVSIVSAAGCPSAGPQTIVYTVHPLPTRGGFSTAQPTCFSTSAQDVLYFSGTTGTGNQYTLTWAPSGGPDDVSTFTGLGANIDVHIAAGVPVGTYTGTLSVKNSATGCTQTVGTLTQVINGLPTITLTGTDAGTVCAGVPSSLTYSATTNSPNQYTITWDGTATSNGFPATNTGSVSGTSGVISVPTSLSTTTAGEYSGTVTVTNTATTCVSASGIGITVSVNPSPVPGAVGVTGAATCAGTDVNVTVSASTLADGSYSFQYSLGAPNGHSVEFGTATIGGGSGILTIPGTLLTTAGNSLLTISDITSEVSSCPAGVHAISTLTVNALPAFVSINSSNTLCTDPVHSDDVTYSYTGLSIASTYTLNWSAGGPSTTSGTVSGGLFTVTVPVSTPAATYTGTLTVTTSTGTSCVQTFPLTLIVNPLPAITLSNSAVNNCAGSVATFNYSGTANTPTGYSIAWTDATPLIGSSSTGSVSGTSGSINITVPSTDATGLYNGNLTVTNANSCTSYPATAVTVSVNAVPQSAGLTATGNLVCVGADATVSVSAASLLAGDYTVTYQVGSGPSLTASLHEGSTGGAASFTVPYASGLGVGNNFVSLTSIAYSVTPTCTSSVIWTATVSVNPVPSSTGITALVANDNPICVGGVSHLVTNDINTTGYSWAASTGAVPTGQNPIVSPTTTTTYSVTLSSTGAGCTSGVYAITVTVNAVPTANPIPGGPVCLTGTVNIPANATGGNPPYTYLWSGVGILSSTSASATVSAIPTAVGSPSSQVYSVAVSTPGANCTNTTYFTTTVTVNPNPNVTTFNVTGTDICSGGTPNFTIGSSLVNGTYTFSYTIAPGGVFTTPSALTTTGGVVTFPAGTTLSTGSTATITTITINSVIDGVTGCSVTSLGAHNTFNVNPYPVVSGLTVTVNDLCVGGGELAGLQSTSLISGNYTVTYSLSGGNTASGLTATTNVTLGTGGSFLIPSSALTNTVNTTVAVTAIQFTGGTACSSPVTGVSASFNVNPLPVVSTFTPVAADICLGFATTVNVTSSSLAGPATYIVHYDLSAPNASTNNTATLSIDGSGNGSFIIPSGVLGTSGSTTVTVTSINYSTGTSCSSTLTSGNTSTFHVNPHPVVSGFSITAADLCAGGAGTATVTAGSLVGGTGAYSVVYGLSGANTTGGSATMDAGGVFTIPSGSLTSQGLTTVTVTSVFHTSGTMCSSPVTTANTANFTVKPDATLASVTNDGPLCVGGTVHLSANTPSNVTGYSWVGADAITSSTSAVATIASASATNVYTVTVNNGAGSACTTQYTTNVSVNPVPTAVPTNNGGSSLCLGTAVTLYANPTGGVGIYTYHWSGVGVALAIAGTTNATPTATGTAVYSLTVSTGGSGCLSGTIYTTSVSVGSGGASLTGTTELCPGTSTTLHPGTTGGTFSSSNTAIATVDPSSGSWTGIATGTAVIEYSLAGGCSSFTTVTVDAGPNVSMFSTASSYTYVDAGAVIVVKSGTLPPSTYTLTYTLSGANTGGPYTTSLPDVVFSTISGGTGGGFTTGALHNPGAETITINSIKNAASGCTTTLSSGNSASFEVNPVVIPFACH